jgi:cobalamin biosynthesis protein CobD/CbiB
MDYTQFIKPFLLALLMLFSMLFLGFNWGPSIMFAVIPFALGSLNIMTRLAYSLTALALICAALSTVLKREDLDGIRNYIRSFVETVEKDKAQKDSAK